MVIGFVDAIAIVRGALTTGRALKRGLSQPCTNWSGAGAAPLMGPRQVETNDPKSKCRCM